MKPKTVIETAYACLIGKMAKAARDENKDLSERIYDAIKLFEELWPEDCKRWNERYLRIKPANDNGERKDDEGSL